MHPDVTRAVASTRVRDMLAAAERIGLARQARRGARQAKADLARPGQFRRAIRLVQHAPARRPLASEPADGCGGAGHRAA